MCQEDGRAAGGMRVCSPQVQGEPENIFQEAKWGRQGTILRKETMLLIDQENHFFRGEPLPGLHF